VAGVLFFREPPGVLGSHYVGVDTGVNFGPLSYFTPDGFYNDPLAFFNPLLGSSIGMISTSGSR